MDTLATDANEDCPTLSIALKPTATNNANSANLSDLPEIVTVEEVATALRVHPRTLYRLWQKRELPGFRVGGAWRMRKADLLALMNSNAAPV